MLGKESKNCDESLLCYETTKMPVLLSPSSNSGHPFPASQLDMQNTQSSNDELHPNDTLAARLDTCTSLEAAAACRTISVSPLQQEIRRLAAPLSKEQLIEIIASAAAVSPSVHKLVQATAVASPAARRIMVRNIHYNTTDAQFTAHFSQFGLLEDAAIVREKFGRSKGFGFVTFKNIESMYDCINSPLHLDGRKLFVKVAADPFSEFLSDGAPIQGRMTRRKIFIRNLPTDCNVDELRDTFSQFGPIEDCAVVSDMRGRSRGFAFITYATQEGAVKASAEPQQTFGGRVIFVSIAKSCTRQLNKSKSPSPLPRSQHVLLGSTAFKSERSNVLYDPWTESDNFLDLLSGTASALGRNMGTNHRAAIHGGDNSSLPPFELTSLGGGLTPDLTVTNTETLFGQYNSLYPYSAAAAAAAFNLIAAQSPNTQAKASFPS